MSVFNYNTKIDRIGSLQARIAKLEKLLKALKFWEVNDIQLGDDILKRRKVTPSLAVGVVAKGPWFDVDMGAGTGGGVTSIVAGSGITVSAATGDVTVSHDWAKYEFGIYSITDKVVRVNAGEVQDSLLNPKTAGAEDITVADSGITYIFLEYTYGGALSIKGSTSRPVMDATTYRRILHWWQVVDGLATLIKISPIGNIVIPGTFASEA